MSGVAVESVVRGQDMLGESPLWCGRTKRLWWVDIRRPALQSYDPLTRAHDIYPVQGRSLGCIALRASGGLMLAIDTALHGYDPLTGIQTPLIDLEPGKTDHRLNDGKCDRAGRFWVGSMVTLRREPHGSLYRVGADLGSVQLLDRLIIPNSIAFSPDDRTMYFADTHEAAIRAYDFDLATGVIANKRVFVDMTGHPGRPDGSCIDAEGFLWNAEYGGQRIVRYAPDGRIDRVVPMPASQSTCCAFGGEQLDTLFVTSARQNLSPERLEAEPEAGSLFAIDVGVRGLPEPLFGG